MALLKRSTKKTQAQDKKLQTLLGCVDRVTTEKPAFCCAALSHGATNEINVYTQVPLRSLLLEPKRLRKDQQIRRQGDAKLTVQLPSVPGANKQSQAFLVPLCKHLRPVAYFAN